MGGIRSDVHNPKYFTLSICNQKFEMDNLKEFKYKLSQYFSIASESPKLLGKENVDF